MQDEDSPISAVKMFVKKNESRVISFNDVLDALSKEYGGQAIRSAIYRLLEQQKIFMNNDNIIRTRPWN